MDYKDFETKGYTVIRSFLTPDELLVFKSDFDFVKRLQFSAPTNNYNIVPTAVHLRIKTKITDLIKEISKNTDVSTDLIVPTSYYYSNLQSARYYYHQDHESFYVFQQNRNYLNFWIPIIKPDPVKSGLIVIPMDQLKELIPNDIDRVIGNGATGYYPDGNITRVVNDNDDSEYTLPANITTIEVIPELNEGDLLLMRGDLIHSTQDTDTDRTAISIRCTKSTEPISKKVFLDGGQRKKEILAGVPKLVDDVLAKFKKVRKEVITARDFLLK